MTLYFTGQYKYTNNIEIYFLNGGADSFSRISLFTIIEK